LWNSTRQKFESLIQFDKMSKRETNVKRQRRIRQTETPEKKAERQKRDREAKKQKRKNKRQNKEPLKEYTRKHGINHKRRYIFLLSSV
jgi:hypothetical protein